MNQASAGVGVITVDGTNPRPNRAAFVSLARGRSLAVRIPNLVSLMDSKRITRSVMEMDAAHHADVPGLGVIGISHFQAARDPRLLHKYRKQVNAEPCFLRCFSSVLGYLRVLWPYGCVPMELPSEGILAPYVVRIYGRGVGIEPHQDLLSAESPDDPLANQIQHQFAVNLYLSQAEVGGSLRLYSSPNLETQYSSIRSGAKTIDRKHLPPPEVNLHPNPGEAVVFNSRKIHEVSPNASDSPRITLSFFLGLTSMNVPLYYWA